MPRGGPLDVLGTAEIRALLGVSRQRVQQLTASPGFPAPAAHLGLGKIWHADDVRAWLVAHPRPGGGPAAGDPAGSP